ncbi:hypothetical protein J3E74DRAFT_297011 [Bipolaris maydis]|nr:hypothetical protein J3E74DRAFT_297011 [Bipolaris maydis]
MPPKRQGNRSKKGPVSKGPDLKKEYEDASPFVRERTGRATTNASRLARGSNTHANLSERCKDMVAGDANQSSAALRDLYNEIKRLSAKEPDGLHDIAALTGQFEEGDENAAVVLSRAENQEVFVLDTERRLQVTVNDQTAHVDLIRRVPTGVGNQRLGHFIEVPLGHRSPSMVSHTPIRVASNGSPEVTSQEVGNEAETTESMSELFQALANEQIQHEFAEVEAVEEVEEDEYSDAFTEDGRRIENPHSYFKTRLNQHLEDKVASLIPRVIASINHRQPENAGFSFIHESTVFRPDRTLLTALTNSLVAISYS